MFDRVVLPVDGSEAANRAAHAGLAVADLFDAEVAVVTVVEAGFFGLTRGDEDERLRGAAQAVLDEVVSDAEDRDLAISSEVLEGNAAERIAEFADEWNADLLVMGRQGKTGLGKRILGSTTEGVIHFSDVPVLVVPEAVGEFDAAFERILVPTDGSENAERAAAHAGGVADRTGAAVDAVYVLDIQAAGGPFGAGGLDQEFVDRLEARGEDALDRVATMVDEDHPDLDVETELVRASGFAGVTPAIEDYVTEHDVDLVVMGSHGRSNLERQLLGSVASSLLRTLEIPVLVVTRDE
ncbi:universal stress protein [Halobacteriales archaeon Cl-PHB]